MASVKTLASPKTGSPKTGKKKPKKRAVAAR
jgi:hypothetical protein